jgi:hypothetical protein
VDLHCSLERDTLEDDEEDLIVVTSDGVRLRTPSPHPTISDKQQESGTLDPEENVTLAQSWYSSVPQQFNWNIRQNE